MAFKIVRSDITKVRSDAIVNTANPFPVVGKGTDTAVYNAAGREELLEARKKIGNIEKGHSEATPSFNLENRGIKYIIHTAGTHYGNGEDGQEEILRNCYRSALAKARELKCRSVAVPLLATGFYGFPKDLGLQIAVDEISAFLLENDIEVKLVVYDSESYRISEKLFDDIEDFLAENYEEERVSNCEAFPVSGPKAGINKAFSKKLSAFQPDIFHENSASFQSERIIEPIDVDAFISTNQNELNFQNRLQKLIAEKNVENSVIYTKAFMDRKFFSKIISTENYVPKKQTVMALGLALELPLDQYEDFLASAGYAFMPSSKFDLVVKFCVMKGIYNLVEVDIILNDHGLKCFSPS